jgi:hypothetical protein
MKLDELIRKRFCDSEELTKRLATFSDMPAVFCPAPPDDKDSLWGEMTHYPRLIFNYDMQANEERKSVGTLAITLVCQNTSEVFPEEIEPLVKNCLRDVLMKPDEHPLYAFSWAKTEGFEMQTGSTELLIGSEIRFDILEYSSQITTDPDPIMAANKYIKELYPESVVIGYDRMSDITESTKENPVIYCRLVESTKARETNTVAWMDGRIAVHILCPDSETRKKMTAAIAKQASLDGEIIMLDRSPMFIKRLQVSYTSDYLKSGLIFVTGEYGLLRYRAKGRGIKNIHVEEKLGGF